VALTAKVSKARMAVPALARRRRCEHGGYAVVLRAIEGCKAENSVAVGAGTTSNDGGQRRRW